MVPFAFTGSSGRSPRRPAMRVWVSRKYGARLAAKSSRFELSAMLMSQVRPLALRNVAAAARLAVSIIADGSREQFTSAHWYRSAKLFELPTLPSINRGTSMPLRMKQCTCRFH